MTRRVALFGMQIDALILSEAVRQIFAWVDAGEPLCHYVVTPNVDHVVQFQQCTGLRAAYADASLVLADGLPVVKAAGWLGQPLPERIAGSDLVPALFAAASERCALRVYLLGAAPGVAARAAKIIEARWPNVRVVGTFSPPFGFEGDARENEHILERIATARPDVLIVGLGAPKQEFWVHRHRERIRATTALCVGATIDFLAGEKNRAPRWMQTIGLEWLHRMLCDPRRLVPRYALDAWLFPRIIAREWLRRRTSLKNL